MSTQSITVIPIYGGLNGWTDIPSDLISQLGLYLCNDFRDLHRIPLLCSQWNKTFKYAMNNNEEFYYKLLSTAILELFLDNDKYCNWVDTKCRISFSKSQKINTLYNQYEKYIEKAYYDIFDEEENTDANRVSKSFLFKSIAQEFTDMTTLFLFQSMRVNAGMCLATYNNFKENKYLKRIILILQSCAENHCVILCGYLLNYLLKICKRYKWKKKAAWYLKDCVIVCFGSYKYYNQDFCNNIISVCDKLTK